MLGVDRALRLLVVLLEPDLDHLPVPLVQTEVRSQVVVVVDVEEPVLEPQAPVTVAAPAPVDAVAQVASLAAELDVHRAVRLGAEGEQVGCRDHAVVLVGALSEEVQGGGRVPAAAWAPSCAFDPM